MNIIAIEFTLGEMGMSKSIHFNNGTLSTTKNQATWILPDSQVRCVSLGELDYLKKERDFAVPLISIEHKNKNIHFTWKVSEGLKPISSVSEEREWFKLKTAKSFVEIVYNFEESENLQLVYEPVNFFIDENHRVKVLFYTNPVHLPCQGEDENNFLQIKKILGSLFTSIPKKDLEKVSAQDIVQKTSKEKREFVSVLMETETLDDAKKVIDDEYNRYLSMQDEHEKVMQKNTKTKQKTLLFLFVGLVVALSSGYMVYSKVNNLQAEVEDLESFIESQEEELDHVNTAYETHLTVYEAYYAGEMEMALQTAQKLKKDSNALDNALYIELLIRNGQAQEVIDQQLEEVNAILNSLIGLGLQEEIMELSADDPYLKFEQAIINANDEALISIIPEITKPTERQQQLIFEVYLRNDLDQAYEYADQHDNSAGKVQVLETKVKQLKNKISKLDEKDDAKEIKPLEAEVKVLTEEIKELKE